MSTKFKRCSTNMASSKNKLTGFLKWVASGWMLILFFVLFFLFWEYSIPLFDVPRYILPAPTEIVQKGSADIDKLIYYTGVTGLETIIGYAIAIILGLGFGIAISFSSILRRTLYPFFVSIEMTPKIAFAPLFISWFGHNQGTNPILYLFHHLDHFYQQNCLFLNPIFQHHLIHQGLNFHHLQ